MQNLIQLRKTKFLASGNHSIQFSQILMPLKVTFPSIENIFFNESFIQASGNLFSVQWKQYPFVQSFFCSYKSLLKSRETNFKRKTFSWKWKHFLQFSCQEKQIFRIVEMYFSTDSSFRVVEADFLASSNHCFIFFQKLLPIKAFFCLIKRYL